MSAAAPLRFASRMTDVETLMWRLGRRHPEMVSTMSMVVQFDGRLDRGALRRRMAEVVETIPRLRDRVMEGPLGTAPPWWSRDPSFSLDRHVRVARSSLPLLEAAEVVVAEPFEEGRPPWRVVLVPGPSGDGLVLHLHHSYTDGLGGVQLMATLFDFSPEPAGSPPDASGPDPTGGAGLPDGGHGLGGVAGELAAEARRSAGMIGRAVPWAWRSAVEAASAPEDTLAAARRRVAGARRQMASASGPASSLLAERDGSGRLARLSVPVPAMRAVGRRIGGTVNDIFLAGLLEGLARYHGKHGVAVPSLRLGIPISARGRSSSSAGGAEGVVMHNQVLGAVLRAPIGASGSLDFAERARLVHEMVLLARADPWLDLVEEVAGLAIRTPGAVGILARAFRGLDVLASNVVGPPLPMYLAGATVEEMVPYGPRSGAAANVTLISYCDTAFLGFNLDRRAVPDPAVLLDCVQSAFEEGLAYG